MRSPGALPGINVSVLEWLAQRKGYGEAHLVRLMVLFDQARKAVRSVWVHFRGRSHSHYIRLLCSHLNGCQIVVDLGCGSNPVVGDCPDIGKVVGVDAWFEALRSARHAPKYVGVLQARLPELPIKPRSVDAVVLLQVLEHLPKDRGYCLLAYAERIARCIVVVTTPNGHVTQGEHNGNPYQRHLSGWSVEDFLAQGYRVFGLEGPKCVRAPGTSQLLPPQKVWQIVISFGLFESYLLSRPRRAFQLMAVKSVGHPQRLSRG